MQRAVVLEGVIVWISAFLEPWIILQQRTAVSILEGFHYDYLHQLQDMIQILESEGNGCERNLFTNKFTPTRIYVYIYREREWTVALLDSCSQVIVALF